jgi:hypothetical protein
VAQPSSYNTTIAVPTVTGIVSDLTGTGSVLFRRAYINAYLILLIIPLIRMYSIVRFFYFRTKLATPAGKFITALTQIPYTTSFFIKSQLGALRAKLVLILALTGLITIAYMIRNIDTFTCLALPQVCRKTSFVSHDLFELLTCTDETRLASLQRTAFVLSAFRCCELFHCLFRRILGVRVWISSAPSGR